MAKTYSQQSFKHFDKYDFVKAFVATVSVSDPKVKEDEEKRAVIIADAIEETRVVLFEHLVTKEDLKKDLALLKKELVIQLTTIMAALLTFLPLVTEFVKKLFSS